MTLTDVTTLQITRVFAAWLNREEWQSWIMAKAGTVHSTN